jgi:predicted ATPase
MVSATEQLHSVAWTLMLQADAYAKLGRLTDGMRCLAEAEQIIERTNERCELADLYRLRSDLLVPIDDRLAAEENYRRALVVAKQQSARPFELRAATSLARLWRDQGKRSEAHHLLAPIYGWFTEGFHTPVLHGAKVLLDELGGCNYIA